VYRASPEASQALLLEFANDSEYIEEVVLKTSNPGTRTAVVDLLVTCLQASYRIEEPVLMECSRSLKHRLDVVASNGGKPLDDSVKKGSDSKTSTSGSGAGSVDPPQSAICTLMETLLGLIRSANRQWRTFDQYWQLFNETARLGPTAVRMLVHLDMIDRACDFFMGEQSPVKDKFRKDVKYDVMGTYTQPANWGPMLYMLQALVCSLKFPSPVRVGAGAKGTVAKIYRAKSTVSRTTAYTSQPPTLIGDGVSWPLLDGDESPATTEDDVPISIPLPVYEVMCSGVILLTNADMLVVCLKNNQAADAVVDMLAHLSWENPSFVDSVMPNLSGSNGIQYANVKDWKPFVLAYKKLIALEDSLQMRRTHLLLGDPFTNTHLYGVGLGFPPKELPRELNPEIAAKEAEAEVENADAATSGAKASGTSAAYDEAAS